MGVKYPGWDMVERFRAKTRANYLRAVDPGRAETAVTKVSREGGASARGGRGSIARDKEAEAGRGEDRASGRPSPAAVGEGVVPGEGVARLRSAQGGRRVSAAGDNEAEAESWGGEGRARGHPELFPSTEAQRRVWGSG